MACTCLPCFPGRCSQDSPTLCISSEKAFDINRTPFSGACTAYRARSFTAQIQMGEGKRRSQKYPHCYNVRTVCIILGFFQGSRERALCHKMPAPRSRGQNPWLTLWRKKISQVGTKVSATGSVLSACPLAPPLLLGTAGEAPSWGMTWGPTQVMVQHAPFDLGFEKPLVLVCGLRSAR